MCELCCNNFNFHVFSPFQFACEKYYRFPHQIYYILWDMIFFMLKEKCGTYSVKGFY